MRKEVVGATCEVRKVDDEPTRLKLRKKLLLLEVLVMLLVFVGVTGQFMSLSHSSLLSRKGGAVAESH